MKEQIVIEFEELLQIIADAVVEQKGWTGTVHVDLHCDHKIGEEPHFYATAERVES